jgi:hypothetical protein
MDGWRWWAACVSHGWKCCWSVVEVVVVYGICYFPLFLYFYCNPGVAYSRGRWVGFLYF